MRRNGVFCARQAQQQCAALGDTQAMPHKPGNNRIYFNELQKFAQFGTGIANS